MYAIISNTAIASSCPQPAKQVQNIQVKRVIDGDTLILKDRRKLRLIGVNTQEINYGKGLPEPFAIAAHDFVSKQSPEIVTLANDGKAQQDRYGRTLAHLYLSNRQPLSEAIIERGLGFYIAYPQNKLLTQCLIAAEKRARKAKLGLWSLNNVPLAAQKLSLKDKGFKLLTGKISKISKTRRYWYLELDEQISIKINTALAKNMRTDLILGQHIEARGWLIKRQLTFFQKIKGYLPLILSIRDDANLELINNP